MADALDGAYQDRDASDHCHGQQRIGGRATPLHRSDRRNDCFDPQA